MRKGEKLLKELGINPRTRKQVNVFESKSGRYLKKGFRRIGIPDDIKTGDLTLEVALELLKG
jgi:topoisomerase IA-like protein